MNRKTNESKEVKFYPHSSGQQQSMTFDTVKDRIIQYVQKTYRHGLDIAKSLRDEQKKDLTGEKPTRVVSMATDKDTKVIEQEGHNIEYLYLNTTSV